MKVTELLPINQMEIPDWDKIRSGFGFSGTKDAPIPIENVFSSEIINYLLNTQLHISSYTSYYQKFSFGVIAHVWERLIPVEEGVEILDQIDELVLNLEVKIDGKRFAKVNKHQALQMIAQLMLDSIPKYLFHRKDFDGQKFYDDVLPILQPIADGTRTFQDEEFPL